MQQRKLTALSQYVMASSSQQLTTRTVLLHPLWEARYKVSQRKAQICQDQVKYLGFQQNLIAKRK
jgi:hypothetical protein